MTTTNQPTTLALWDAAEKSYLDSQLTGASPLEVAALRFAAIDAFNAYRADPPVRDNDDDSVTVGTLTIKFSQDSDPQHPREGDNLGILCVTHGASNLAGDGDLALDRDALSEHDRTEARRYGRTRLPVYLYRHGGDRVRTGSFHGLLPQGHAYFDSAQCGFIYTTSEKVREFLGDSTTFKRDNQKIEDALRAEIETLDDYLSGNVWQYEIVGSDDDCFGGRVGGRGGYLGDFAKCGIKGDAIAEAKRVIAKQTRPTSETETIPLPLTAL